MDSILLNSIKSIYSNSLASIRIKGSKRELFRIDSGVRKGWGMCFWFLYGYMAMVVKVAKNGLRRMRKIHLGEYSS